MANVGTAEGQDVLQQLTEELGFIQQNTIRIKDEIQEKMREMAKEGERAKDIAQRLSDFASGSTSSERRETPNARKNLPPREEEGRGGKGGTGKPKGRQGGQRTRPRMGGEVPLREYLWDIMDRSPTELRKFLPDYPSNARGCKVAEFREVVMNEGKWTSTNPETVAAQIQGHLFNLTKEKLVEKADDRRYFRKRGATLPSKNR